MPDTQSLAAMFQAMQGQDPSQNPLAQMMNQGGDQTPAPDATPLGTPTIMQAPQAPQKPPTPEEALQAIATQQAQLKQQYDQASVQLQQAHIILARDPSQDIPDALKNFDKYNEDQYQQAYGGGGVLGVAGRALANLFSGLGSGRGQTLKEQMTEQNLAKYKEAVAAATQQTQAQKAAAAQDAQNQLAQLNILKEKQKQLDDAQKHIEAQQNISIKSDTLANTKTKTAADIRQKDEQLRIEALKLDKEANTPFAAIRDKINDERKAAGAPPLNPAELQNLNLQVKQTPPSQTENVYHWIDSEQNVHATPYSVQHTPQPVGKVVPELGTAPAGAAPAKPAASTPKGDTIIGQGKLPGTEVATRDFARTLEPKFDHINDLIDKLDKNGQLNLITSRWNEFMSGKLGHDPTYDQDYIRLREAVNLAASGLSRVHNPRGAATGQIQKLEENFKVGKMDASTLKAGLDEARLWVNGYAHMGEKPSNKPMTLEDFKKKHGIK